VPVNQAVKFVKSMLIRGHKSTLAVNLYRSGKEIEH